MKRFITSFILFILAFSLNAQDIKNFGTAFYKEVVFETDLYKLYLVKCFSRDNVIKCKIRLYNKSKQAMYIKAEEFEFVVNGEKYHCDKTHFVIEPDDIADRMVEITGKNLKQEKFEITTTGIYTINDNPEVITMPDTKWPSKHGTEVNGTGIKCHVITNRMHPDKSGAAYSCKYEGDQFCVIDPTKAISIMPKGQENLSAAKPKLYVLENGDTRDFHIEFNRYNGAGSLLEGINVVWKETFTKVSPKLLAPTKVEMLFDPLKSEK